MPIFNNISTAFKQYNLEKIRTHPVQHVLIFCGGGVIFAQIKAIVDEFVYQKEYAIIYTLAISFCGFIVGCALILLRIAVSPLVNLFMKKISDSSACQKDEKRTVADMMEEIKDLRQAQAKQSDVIEQLAEVKREIAQLSKFIAEKKHQIEQSQQILAQSEQLLQKGRVHLKAAIGRRHALMSQLEKQLAPLGVRISVIETGPL
jgi:hypothetical protein